MWFVIDYDRPKGDIVQIQAFPPEGKAMAEDLRLDLELDLNRRGVKGHEVVLLDAADEAAIRRTHSRYFETAEELLDDARRLLGVPP